MAEQLLITAMGKDRPGILTRLTQLIGRCSGNVHDSRQAIMGDQFTLIMLLTGDRAAISRIEHQLPPLAVELELLTMMKRTSASLHETTTIAAQLNLEGPDQPGITGEVADFLAERGLNVHTLQSSTDDTAREPRFQLTMALQSPVGDTDWAALEADLKPLCQRMQLRWQLDVMQ